jgi:hypothetical protein
MLAPAQGGRAHDFALQIGKTFKLWPRHQPKDRPAQAHRQHFDQRSARPMPEFCPVDCGTSRPRSQRRWFDTVGLDKHAPTVGPYRYLQFGVNKIPAQPAIEYSVQQKTHS